MMQRGTKVLDCTQGLFKFCHASCCAAKQYCLQAIMGWEAARTERQEVGGGHRVILEVRSIFRASAKILIQKKT